MIKAVIFDFDGTVADTISAIQEGINLAMLQYGYPQHSYGDIVRFINNGPRMLVKRAMPAELQEDAALVDRVLADYNRFYAQTYLHTTAPYAGVGELIASLHGRYRIGILSNKQDEFVKKLSLQVLPRGSFDAALGFIAGKPAKPDPYLPNLMASMLGVLPSECAMVGDSDVDIATAMSAGMLHIGVSWGYRSEEFLRAHGATRIAHTADEVERLLE